MILFVAASAFAHDTARIDAAFDGLQTYFYNTTFSFWKACGQTGGNGGAFNDFNCDCAKDPSGFCEECFRWWMAGTVGTLVDLNALVPAHRSSSLTLAVVDAMLLRSPYTARYAPSWAYIDDYLWYVLMWLRVARWKGNETSLVDEAAATFDLMWSFGADEACGFTFERPKARRPPPRHAPTRGRARPLAPVVAHPRARAGRDAL